MIIKLLKQKAFEIPPSAEVEAELQDRLDNLYVPEARCANIHDPVFKDQLDRLYEHYADFFVKVGMARNTLAPLLGHLDPNELLGYYERAEDRARFASIKELLENIVIYANAEGYQPQLKALLQDFSRSQEVCTDGLITNLSAILYRLQLGKTPVHWLGDLRDTAHAQSVQARLLKRMPPIDEGMEVHFSNRQKLLPTAEDLGLPTVPQLKKMPDQKRDDPLVQTEPWEDLAIRDQFFINYTSEDHERYVKNQFMDLLKDYWDKEFGAWDEVKDGPEVDDAGWELGVEVKARRKNQRACDDGRHIIEILQPFIDNELFNNDDIFSDDLMHISQEFKDAFDGYCEVLSQDFLYTEEEQEVFFELAEGYLIWEEDAVRPEGSEWLAKSPLGLEFLLTRMYSPDFAFNEILPGRIAQLFNVPWDINHLEARLDVSLKSTAHDRLYEHLAETMLEDFNLEMLLRCITEGGSLEGLSLLFLVCTQPVLKREVLPKLCEWESEQIAAAFGKMGFDALFRAPDVGDHDVRSVFDVLVCEELFFAKLQGLFIGNLRSFVNYLSVRAVPEGPTNFYRLLETGTLDKIFNLLGLKGPILGAPDFARMFLLQHEAPVPKTLLWDLCCDHFPTFFDYLQDETFFDALVHHDGFCDAIMTVNEEGVAESMVIDKLLETEQGRDILNRFVEDKGFTKTIFDDRRYYPIFIKLLDNGLLPKCIALDHESVCGALMNRFVDEDVPEADLDDLQRAMSHLLRAEKISYYNLVHLGKLQLAAFCIPKIIEAIMVDEAVIGNLTAFIGDNPEFIRESLLNNKDARIFLQIIKVRDYFCEQDNLDLLLIQCEENQFESSLLYRLLLNDVKTASKMLSGDVLDKLVDQNALYEILSAFALVKDQFLVESMALTDCGMGIIRRLCQNRRFKTRIFSDPEFNQIIGTLVDKGEIILSEQQRQALDNPCIKKHIKSDRLTYADINLPGDVKKYNAKIARLFCKKKLSYHNIINLSDQQAKALEVKFIRDKFDEDNITLDELDMDGDVKNLEDPFINGFYDKGLMAYDEAINLTPIQKSLLQFSYTRDRLLDEKVPVDEWEAWLVREAEVIYNTLFKEDLKFEHKDREYDIFSLLSVDGFLAVAKAQDCFDDFFLDDTYSNFCLMYHPDLFRKALLVDKVRNPFVEVQAFYGKAKLLIDNDLLILSDRQRHALNYPIIQKCLERRYFSLANLDSEGDLDLLKNEIVVDLLSASWVSYKAAINLTPAQLSLLCFDYIRGEVKGGRLKAYDIEAWIMLDPSRVYDLLGPDLGSEGKEEASLKLLNQDGFLEGCKDKYNLSQLLAKNDGYFLEFLLLHVDGYDFLRKLLALPTIEDALSWQSACYPAAKRLISEGLLQLSEQQRRAYEEPVVGQYLDNGQLRLADLVEPGDLSVFNDTVVAELFEKNQLPYHRAIKLTPIQRSLLHLNFNADILLLSENWEALVICNAKLFYGQLINIFDNKVVHTCTEEDCLNILSIDGFLEACPNNAMLVHLLTKNDGHFINFLEKRLDGIALLRKMLGIVEVANCFMGKPVLYFFARRLRPYLNFSAHQLAAYNHPAIKPYLKDGKLTFADLDVPGDIDVFYNPRVVDLFEQDKLSYFKAINLTRQQLDALAVEPIHRLVVANIVTVDGLKAAGNIHVMDQPHIAKLVEDKMITYKQAINLSEDQLDLLHSDFMSAMVARGQFDIAELPEGDLERFENPVFCEYVDLIGCGLKEALNIPQAIIVRLEGEGLFEYVASYRRAQGSDIVQRLKQWINDEGLGPLLAPEKIADQSEIAEQIRRFIGNNVETIEETSAIYDAIGIGFGDKQGLDDELSVLRYRNLNAFSFHKKMGYRETNDSETIAKDCIVGIQRMVGRQHFVVDDPEQDQLYRHVLAKKISRSGSNEKPLRWYEVYRIKEAAPGRVPHELV